jgi:membrane glycosyltransferase
MQAEGVLSAAVALDLLLVHLRGMHPVMRSIMVVGVITVTSGLWAGDINVPIVLRSLNLSISQVILISVCSKLI